MVALMLEDGREVLVQHSNGNETFGSQALPQRRKRKLADVAEQSAELLAEYISTVRSSLGPLVPEDLRVEIGFTLSLEGHLMLAKGGSEATFLLSAHWKSVADEGLREVPRRRFPEHGTARQEGRNGPSHLEVVESPPALFG